jgi:hypothetical protein
MANTPKMVPETCINVNPDGSTPTKLADVELEKPLSTTSQAEIAGAGAALATGIGLTVGSGGVIPAVAAGIVSGAAVFGLLQVAGSAADEDDNKRRRCYQDLKAIRDGAPTDAPLQLPAKPIHVVPMQ